MWQWNLTDESGGAARTREIEFKVYLESVPWLVRSRNSAIVLPLNLMIHYSFTALTQAAMQSSSTVYIHEHVVLCANNVWAEHWSVCDAYQFMMFGLDADGATTLRSTLSLFASCVSRLRSSSSSIRPLTRLFLRKSRTPKRENKKRQKRINHTARVPNIHIRTKSDISSILLLLFCSR